MAYTSDCTKILPRRANNVQVKRGRTKDGIDYAEISIPRQKTNAKRASVIAKIQQDPLSEAGRIESIYAGSKASREQIGDRLRKATKDHTNRMSAYVAMIKNEGAKLWGRRHG